MENILFILFSIQKLGRQMLRLSVGCLVILFLALSLCSLFICLSRSPFSSPFPSFFLLLFLSLLGPTSYKSEILAKQICHRNNAEFGINKSLSLIIWKQCLCPEPLCRGWLYPEVTVLWGSQASRRGQGLTLWSAVLVWALPAPVPEEWAYEGPNDPKPQLLSNCQLSCLPNQSPRYCGTKVNWPHCALSKCLTHGIHDHNKMVVHYYI